MRLIRGKKCEGCQLKYAEFKLPSDLKLRWCAGCMKAHAGAVRNHELWECDHCDFQGSLEAVNEHEHSCAAKLRSERLAAS